MTGKMISYMPAATCLCACVYVCMYACKCEQVSVISPIAWGNPRESLLTFQFKTYKRVMHKNFQPSKFSPYFHQEPPLPLLTVYINFTYNNWLRNTYIYIYIIYYIIAFKNLEIGQDVATWETVFYRWGTWWQPTGTTSTSSCNCCLCCWLCQWWHAVTAAVRVGTPPLVA